MGYLAVHLEGRQAEMGQTAKADFRRPARANDPKTWNRFDAALFFCWHRKFDGIGYVPTKADGFVFLDFDNVVNPDGTLGTWSAELRAKFSGDVPEPAEIVALLGTYAELSPSGRGLRIICRGSLPQGRRVIGGKGELCPDGFEAYDHAHYLTLTGQRLPQAPATIADCTEKLAVVHLAVFGEEKPDPPAAARSPLPATFLDDMAVIEKASHAKGGEKFQKLWSGDPSDYLSRSVADFALASKLAFYCGPNPSRVERLMRQSGLVRDKWHRRNYLAKTVAKCLKGRTDFYTGRKLIPCGLVADCLHCGDSCVLPEDTVRDNRHKTNNPQTIRNQSANYTQKSEWTISRRIRDKYQSDAWTCPRCFGVAGRADGSPALGAATCRKRSCVVCGQYWKLKTFDRFGFHLHNHDGQLYGDTIYDSDWKAALEGMRRRARKLDVPLRFVTIRDKDDSLVVLASVPIRGDVAHPLELPEALEILEGAIDEANPGPRPINACRAWGRLPDERQVERVPGGCSPASFRATLLAWKVQSVSSGRFLLCDRPGLFLDSDGKLDEQLQCDFWREAETRDFAGPVEADATRERLAEERKRRKSLPEVLRGVLPEAKGQADHQHVLYEFKTAGGATRLSCSICGAVAEPEEATP